MKYLVLLMCILLSQIIQSQSLFKKIKETTKQTSENVILNKAEEKTTNTLDSAFSKKKHKKSSKNEDKIAHQTDSVKPTFLKQYSKFVFTPGETVVYYRDFVEDNIGELPTGWNINGSGEVVTFNNLSGNWLKLMQNSTFLTDNTSLFEENFTVEFDLMFNSLGDEIA